MHPMDRKRIEHVERGTPLHWVGDGFPVRTLLSYSRHAHALLLAGAPLNEPWVAVPS